MKAAGARWNAEKKLWLVGAAAVRALMLHDRVVGWLDLP
jgi:hypothetical protein